MYSHFAAIVKVILTKVVPEGSKSGKPKIGEFGFALLFKVTPAEDSEAINSANSTPLNKSKVANIFCRASGERPFKLTVTVAVSGSPQMFKKSGTEVGLSNSTFKLSCAIKFWTGKNAKSKLIKMRLNF